MIEGTKVNLRPITEEDTGLILKWRNSERVSNNFIFSEKLTAEMHKKWLEEKVNQHLVEQFIIIEKESNKPIGSVYFRDIDKTKKEAEYGIFIGEDHAIGKGYGNETAKLALKYAFETMGLKRIFLRVFADNKAAIKSYENAGFKLMNREEIINKNEEDRKLVFMDIERKQLD